MHIIFVAQETRQKQKVTDIKIQQAEDAYLQAKQAFDEVTDVLYEELPTLFDRWVWSIVYKPIISL